MHSQNPDPAPEGLAYAAKPARGARRSWREYKSKLLVGYLKGDQLSADGWSARAASGHRGIAEELRKGAPEKGHRRKKEAEDKTERKKKETPEIDLKNVKQLQGCVAVFPVRIGER